MAATEDSNPFAFVIDFSAELSAEEIVKSDLHPEVAWILYDKSNQQIVKRGHQQINLDFSKPNSQIFSSEFYLADINKLFKEYYYPELVVENHDLMITLNKKILNPNLQIDKVSHFSVVDDYQSKTELPLSSLEEILLSLGKSTNKERLTNLSARANKILEYYLESIARKEREQPYSRVPREIKTPRLSIGKIIGHYFVGLTITTTILLTLYLFFNIMIIKVIIYLLIAAVTSLFIFQHLRR